MRSWKKLKKASFPVRVDVVRHDELATANVTQPEKKQYSRYRLKIGAYGRAGPHAFPTEDMVKCTLTAYRLSLMIS